jgi:hypothetical protein
MWGFVTKQSLGRRTIRTCGAICSPATLFRRSVFISLKVARQPCGCCRAWPWTRPVPKACLSAMLRAALRRSRRRVEPRLLLLTSSPCAIMWQRRHRSRHLQTRRNLRGPSADRYSDRATRPICLFPAQIAGPPARSLRVSEPIRRRGRQGAWTFAKVA